MRAAILTLIVLLGLGWTVLNPFVGVLLWHWLSLMNPHRMTWGFLAGLPMIMAVGSFTILAWVLSREPKTIPLRAPTVWFVLLLAWFCASTLGAVDPQGAYPKWEETMKASIMVIVSMAMLVSMDRIRTLVWVIALSLGFYGLKGTVFGIVTAGQYRVWGPAASFIADNNALGLALVMTIPLWWFLYEDAKKRWLRLFCFAMGASCAIAALLTYSRGTLLGLGVLAFLAWARSGSKVLTASALAVILLAGLPMLPDHWWDRMRTIQNYEEDGSAMSRLRQWHMAILIARDHPLGGGFKVFVDPTIDEHYADQVGRDKPREAHSIYFQMLGEHGFAGLVLFLGLGMSTLLGLMRVVRAARWQADLTAHRRLALALIFSLSGYAVSGAFLSLAYFDLYYLLIALSVALTADVARLRQAGSRPFGLAPQQQPFVGHTKNATGANTSRRRPNARLSPPPGI